MQAAAAAAGVRRFVFVSSIKFNGEAPAPRDIYDVSKLEAEQGLLALSAQIGTAIVIIRWLQRGAALPLGGAIHKQRSLVAQDNLVDLIVCCITYPTAVNQTFLVSDGEDVSTKALLRRMGHGMGQPARLMPFSASLLTLAATM